MNILQIIPNISGGGAERLVVDLCNELIINNDVNLLSLYDSSEKDLFRKDLCNSIPTWSLGKESGFDWKIIPKIFKTVQEINPHIIHCHLRSFNYLMPIIPFMNHKPIVYTIHNDAYKECQSSYIRRIRRQFFKRKNVLPVTISGESSDSFSKAYKNIRYTEIKNGRKYPSKSNKYNSVVEEMESFKKRTDSKIFVHIGRVQPQKNQLMLVKAFNKLIYRDKLNAILVIIGGERSDEESRRIFQQLKQLKQKHDHIYLLGERPNATDYLHVSDFFCLSSLYEGMPITMIEAFATGCIPLSTPVGGIPEMISELDESLLSNSISVEDYYQLLKKAMSFSDRKREELIQKGKKLFELKYSMKICAGEYLKFFRKIVSS